MINSLTGIMSSGITLRADTLAYKAAVEADGGTVFDLTYVNKCFEVIAAAGSDLEKWITLAGGIKVALDNGRITKVYDLVGTHHTNVGAPMPTTDTISGRRAVFQTSGNVIQFAAISSGAQKYVTTVGRFTEATINDGMVWQMGNSYNLYYNSGAMLGFNDLAGNQQNSAVTFATMSVPVLTEALIYGSNASPNKLWVNSVSKTLSGTLTSKVLETNIQFYHGSAFADNNFMEGVVFKNEPSSGIKTSIRNLLNTYYSIP